MIAGGGRDHETRPVAAVPLQGGKRATPLERAELVNVLALEIDMCPGARPAGARSRGVGKLHDGASLPRHVSRRPRRQRTPCAAARARGRPPPRRVNASQWMPITSVWSPSRSTAAKAAKSHASRRHKPARIAMLQRTNASTPATPASTPSSVYVDSPALISTPVRFATTPAFPSPWPCGCSITTRTPSRRLRQWLSVDASSVGNRPPSIGGPSSLAFWRSNSSSSGV